MVFSNWLSASVVTVRGTQVFPPDQRLSRRRGRVPVYLGVTVRPGDTERSAIERAIEQFPEFLAGYLPDELRLKIRDF